MSRLPKSSLAMQPRTRAQTKSLSENETVAGLAHVKRAALESSPSAASTHNPKKLPKRENRTFGDITNSLSSVAIDSGKKNQTLAVVKTRAGLASVAEEGSARTTSAIPRPASLPALSSIDAAAPTSVDAQSSSCDGSVFDGLDETPQRADPCPEYDYDSENKGSLYEVADYARGIFVYYRTREAKFAVKDYLHRQNGISKSMRMILIDWMVEIQENFELNHETLYLAVKMTDRFLEQSERVISKEDLQLVGATALFVASKFDERQPPCLDDFLYICDDAYSKPQLLALEREILMTLGFDLAMPLSYRYLRRYSKAGKLTMEVLTLARYVLETSLMSYEFVGESEARMAAAALLLALRMRTVEGGWSPKLRKYSGFEEAEVEELMWALNKMLHTPLPKTVSTIHSKYSHEVFHKVALTKPLDPRPVLPML